MTGVVQGMFPSKYGDTLLSGVQSPGRGFFTGIINPASLAGGPITGISTDLSSYVVPSTSQKTLFVPQTLEIVNPSIRSLQIVVSSSSVNDSFVLQPGFKSRREINFNGVPFRIFIGRSFSDQAGYGAPRVNADFDTNISFRVFNYLLPFKDEDMWDYLPTMGGIKIASVSGSLQSFFQNLQPGVMRISKLNVQVIGNGGNFGDLSFYTDYFGGGATPFAMVTGNGNALAAGSSQYYEIIQDNQDRHLLYMGIGDNIYYELSAGSVELCFSWAGEYLSWPGNAVTYGTPLH